MAATSCSDTVQEPEADSAPSAQKVSVVYVENGGIVTKPTRATDAKRALCFESEAVMERFSQSLADAPDDEVISTSNIYGVKTLASIAIDADDELEAIGASATSEADFRNKYNAYVKKYANTLVANTSDAEDLTLYAPEDNQGTAYIANEDGVYVVNGEVKKLSARQVPSYAKDINSDNISPTLNKCNIYPETHKRIKCAISRKKDKINLKMHAQKKMWYGWKDDKARILVFECDLINMRKLYTGQRPTTQHCAGFKDWEIGEATGDVSGRVYLWTDYAMEKDASGRLIYEMNQTGCPYRCPYSTAHVMNVSLKK